MKKITKKEIMNGCDAILRVFDEDFSVNNAMAEQTEDESERIYDALEKGGLIDSRDLIAHENNIRSVAFAMGYLFGTGHIVIASDKTTKEAVSALTKSLKVAKKR